MRGECYAIGDVEVLGCPSKHSLVGSVAGHNEFYIMARRRGQFGRDQEILIPLDRSRTLAVPTTGILSRFEREEREARRGYRLRLG